MSRRGWFLVVSLGLLAYGVLCLVRFPIERQRALAVPRMTCRQLLLRGHVADEYVTLTDVRLCRRGFAFWRDAMSPSDVEVFVPVFPADLPSEPASPDLKLLLEVQDADDWRRIRDSGTAEVTCQVHEGGLRVEDWAQRDLGLKYPGLHFAEVLVLTVGLHEPTMAKADMLLRHGIVATSVAVAILLWLRRRKASMAAPVAVSSNRS